MLEYKDPVIRKQLSAILIRIAERIENDDRFLELLLEENPIPSVADTQIRIHNAENDSGKEEEKRTVPDIFALYVKEGTYGLQQKLKTFELSQLREVLISYGLDPAKKVRRWKTKDKVISYVMEAVEKKLAQGNAFMG